MVFNVEIENYFLLTTWTCIHGDVTNTKLTLHYSITHVDHYNIKDKLFYYVDPFTKFQNMKFMYGPNIFSYTIKVLNFNIFFPL